jgi:hypothetical protein
VRVLLDEQLPRQLAPYLVGHEARTVQQQGWAGLKNGDLLKAAEAAGFQVYITADQQLPHQQNVASTTLFVIVVAATSNAIEDLVPAVPDTLVAMAEPRAGQVLRISARS